MPSTRNGEIFVCGTQTLTFIYSLLYAGAGGWVCHSGGAIHGVGWKVYGYDDEVTVGSAD